MITQVVYGLDTKNDSFTPKDLASRVVRVGQAANNASPSNKRTPYESTKSTAKKTQLENFIKSLLRPVSQLITETPDRNRGWVGPASRKGMQLHKEAPFNVVFSSGPPHSTHLAAKKLAHKFKTPWIADFRDPWARTPWKRANNPLGRYFFPYYEASVVNKASKIILNTDSACEDFRSHYTHHRLKFESIPNGIDPELNTRIQGLSIKKDFSTNHLTICHAGSLYGHRDPRPLLKVIAVMRHEGYDVRFLQIGQCDPEFNPEHVAETLGIREAVKVLHHMPHKDVLERMKIADILCVIQPDAKLMIPGKVYEMLAFSAPIIGICDAGATENLIQAAGGFTATKNDETQIKTALTNAISSLGSVDLKFRRQKLCEQFCGKRLTGQLAQLMDSLVTE